MPGGEDSSCSIEQNLLGGAEVVVKLLGQRGSSKVKSARL